MEILWYVTNIFWKQKTCLEPRNKKPKTKQRKPRNLFHFQVRESQHPSTYFFCLRTPKNAFVCFACLCFVLLCLALLYLSLLGFAFPDFFAMLCYALHYVALRCLALLCFGLHCVDLRCFIVINRCVSHVWVSSCHVSNVDVQCPSLNIRLSLFNCHLQRCVFRYSFQVVNCQVSIIAVPIARFRCSVLCEQLSTSEDVANVVSMPNSQFRTSMLCVNVNVDTSIFWSVTSKFECSRVFFPNSTFWISFVHVRCPVFGFRMFDFILNSNPSDVHFSFAKATEYFVIAKSVKAIVGGGLGTLSGERGFEGLRDLGAPDPGGSKSHKCLSQATASFGRYGQPFGA